MNLNQTKINDVKERVVHQGEPQPVNSWEDRVGNLRGLLAYLANSIDTVEELAPGDEWTDASADLWLDLLRQQFEEARTAPR